MANLNPLSMLNAALAGLGSDLKGRMDSDLSDEMFKGGANFTDVMMARVTARQNSSDDVKDIQKDYGDSATKPEWVDQLKYAKPNDKADATAPRDERRPVSERIDSSATEKPRTERMGSERKADSASVSETKSTSVAASSDDETTWSDDRAVTGLKKLASTMLDAEKEGKISLPPSIKQILEKLVAADGTPGQILPLVQDMLGALRKLDLKLSADDLKSTLGEMTWPAELTDLFKDLQINPGAKADQPIELGKLMKALRALGNLVQQKAISKADKQALIDAALIVPTEKKAVDSFKAPEPDKLEVMDHSETDTSSVPKKEIIDVVMNAVPTAAPVAEKPAGTSVLPSASKADDKSASSDDLIAGMAKGARQDRNPSMGGSHSDAAARNASAGAAGASGGPSSSPLSLQFENQPTLAPVAAALSARSSFTAGVAQAASGSNGAAPHPATQQVIVSLQKSAITKDTSLSIQLNPAELGRVDVKITIDQNGKASAQVIADRPETLSMLQKDSSHLEKALQNAGLNSSAQDLHYSLREQNSQQRGQEFAGQKRRRALFDTDEGSQKVSMDAPIAADGLPHRVNYHA